MSPEDRVQEANFNFLHTKILNEHKTKRSIDVVSVDLNKELRRLAKAFVENRVCKSSYQVLKLKAGGYAKHKRYVEIRSRLGFTIQLNSSNIEQFTTWAFGKDTDKGTPMQKKVRFGNEHYHVSCERPTDLETARLNIRHGID